MPLFGSQKKMASQLVGELATLVQQSATGALRQDQYIQAASGLIGELAAGIKVNRFTLDDLEGCLSAADRLGGKERLTLYREISRGLNVANINSLPAEAVSASVQERLRQVAGELAWDEVQAGRGQQALGYADIAEREGGEDARREPGLHMARGMAYWQLQQGREAYQSYVEAEHACNSLLADPSTPAEFRPQINEFLAEARGYMQQLKPHV